MMINITERALAQIIELNNMTVSSHMAHFEYGAGIVPLSIAFRGCSELIQNTGSLTAIEAAGVGRDIPASLDDCMVLEPTLASCPEHRQVPGDECSPPSANRFIYAKPITIPINSETNFKTAVMVASIVAFNLALSYHLSSSPGGEIMALQKAAKLYEVAVSLQRQAQMGSNVLFTLAITNNMGMVHRQMNNKPAAKTCFEFALSILMYATVSNSEKRKEFDGFFQNVSTILSWTCAAPAA